MAQSKADIENMLIGVSPRDGIRVKPVTVGADHSLHFVFYAGGVPGDLPWVVPEPGKPYGVQFWHCERPTNRQLGEKQRLYMLADALCRFINTGGDWHQAQDLLASLWQLAKGLTKFEVPDFYLIATGVNTDGDVESVFASDHGPYAIKWVEDAFFDVVPLVTLHNELLQEVVDGDAGAELPGNEVAARCPADNQTPRPALPAV